MAYGNNVHTLRNFQNTPTPPSWSPEIREDGIRLLHANILTSIACVGAQATGLFGIYSILNGIFGLYQFTTSKEKSCSKYSKLLSGITLFGSTAGWGYQKWMLGSSSCCLLFVGLAIDEGIRFCIAADKLRSYNGSDPIEKRRLQIDTMIRLLRMSAFIALTIGNPAIGCVLFLVAATISIVPFFAKGYFHHPKLEAQTGANSNSKPGTNELTKNYSNNKKELERRSFIAFSGQGHQLGGQGNRSSRLSS